MRNTHRTITCDRCSVETTVDSFSYGGLYGATVKGWTKYVSATAREKIYPNNHKDLCGDCSALIADVILTDESWQVQPLNGRELILDLLGRLSGASPDPYYLRFEDDDLASLRDELTKVLRKRRRSKDQ